MYAVRGLTGCNVVTLHCVADNGTKQLQPAKAPSISKEGESPIAYSVYVHNAAADIIVHRGTKRCAHAVLQQQCRGCSDLESCCPVKQVLGVLWNDILPARGRAGELNVCPYNPACSHTELAS